MYRTAQNKYGHGMMFRKPLRKPDTYFACGIVSPMRAGRKFTSLLCVLAASGYC